MSPFVVLLLLVLSLSYCPSSSAQVAGCPYGDPKVPAVGSGPAADRTSGFVPTASQLAALNNLTNFVILVLSEDSFDNLLATYPGANNLMAYTSSSSYVQQNTAAGTPYSTFPADPSNNIYSSSLPNQPFNLLSANASFTTSTIFTNPSHSFWQTQYKINGGKMDQFITWGDSHATIGMSYYDLSGTPNSGIWGVANQYTLFDRFHMATFGDSVIAHLYLAGTGPVPYNASTPGVCPASVLALAEFAPVNSSGALTDSSSQPPLSCDCYLIGDLNSANLCPGSGLVLPPIPAGSSNPAFLGDLADLAGVSYCWYSEDFLGAEAANCGQSGQRQFNVHEQPFQHFSTFPNNQSSNWNTHMKDASAFWTNLASNSLEQITWYAPAQTHDYGFSNNNPAAGNAFVDSFMANITSSALYQAGKLGVIVTFSDANGMFDHVAPYVGDRFGPGMRVPTIFVSPYHTRSVNKAVNSDPYETYSIHKMLARRFGLNTALLQQLWGTTRYLAAADLTASFPAGSGGCNGAAQARSGSIASWILTAASALIVVLLGH